MDGPIYLNDGAMEIKKSIKYGELEITLQNKLNLSPNRYRFSVIETYYGFINVPLSLFSFQFTTIFGSTTNKLNNLRNTASKHSLEFSHKSENLLS